jgi:hypothetical protein
MFDAHYKTLRQSTFRKVKNIYPRLLSINKKNRFTIINISTTNSLRQFRLPWRSGEICTLSRYYAEFSGNSFPTFRETLFVPFSAVKKSKKKPWISWFLKMGLIRCPDMSVRNYNYTLRNIPEGRRSHRNSRVSHGPLFLIHRLLIKLMCLCVLLTGFLIGVSHNE